MAVERDRGGQSTVGQMAVVAVRVTVTGQVTIVKAVVVAVVVAVVRPRSSQGTVIAWER